MSFGSILYALLFQPLQILFEAIYKFAYSVIQNKGVAIIILSLAMNFLVLPLYRRADAIQEQERNIEAKLEKGVSHIKKTFKGDERMMMLQTYYRQNNYKPTYVLRGVTSLFLQIPFFIAAYRFLSTYSGIKDVSFGLINDLSTPDKLLTLFGISINILPIIMTVINLISSALYSKDYPAKTKIQLYITALFFLVFLYNSPSGLVFYWTLNNAFSLIKTLTLKSKNPAKVGKEFLAIGGIALSIYSFFIDDTYTEKSLVFTLLGIVCVFPILFALVREKNPAKRKPKKIKEYKYNTKLFVAGCVFMAVLTGLVIPSAVISSSPQEFVFTSYYQSPLWYLVSSTCIAVGTFVIWFGVFYWLANSKVRAAYTKAICIISCLAITNYMFFGKNSGILNSSLQYTAETNTISISANEMIVNLIVVAVIIVVMLIIYKKLTKQITSLLLVCTIALCGMGTVNIVKINSSVANIYTNSEKDNTFNIKLSKTGKNVVVIMLDRGFGPYIPYFFNEKPELIKQYDGFTYYSNTISFGGHTNFASSAFFGGYEYTPAEINSRKNEKLVTKHNEALKVMPAIFSSKGYNVTLCNSNYANYQWIPDLSVFDDMKGVKAYNTGDDYVDNKTKKETIKNNRRNFFVYSLMKSSPIVLQSDIYNNGNYLGSSVSQHRTNDYIATGNYSEFIKAYSVLTSLSDITSTTSNKVGEVLLMTNNTTHEPQLLQEPQYEPANQIDNTKYYKDADRFNLNGKKLAMNNFTQIASYETNMASIIQLGNWFDYLREIGVWDNTKIILASDHAFETYQLNDLILNDTGTVTNDMEYFTPLLMVKDFNSTGFNTSDEFMTNADIPTIAFESTVKNPVNPYTNKKIDNQEKYAHKQYIISSDYCTVNINNGNQFLPADWYTTQDSVWDKSNWKLVAKDDVLTNDDVK